MIFIVKHFPLQVVALPSPLPHVKISSMQLQAASRPREGMIPPTISTSIEH